jgi:uncharacterized membrane protein YccC
MTTATIVRPLNLAGVSLSSWAFGIRVWVAVVVALGASFWLELEVPSTAAITVSILAAPTRGRALDKACYRLLATIIGVTAALAIVGLFSHGAANLAVGLTCTPALMSQPTNLGYHCLGLRP